MKILSLLWAGIAAAMLVGCASTGEWNAFNRPFKTQMCPGASCEVLVKVTDSGGVCSATVDDEYLNLKEGANDKNITWTLSSGKFKFSKENYKYAIVIKNDPKGRFSGANVPGGDRLVLRYKRGDTGGNRYAYGLNIQRSDDSFCDMLDPFMVD